MAFFRADLPAVGLLLLVPVVAAAIRGTGGVVSVADLIAAAHIQPAEVSHLLTEVERNWQAEALSVLQNRYDAASSLSAMVDSCVKVSKAIVGGSEGNKDKVVEYLQEVCGADAAGRDKDMCQQYATAFEAHLSDDLNANREDLNVDGFCHAFYKGPIMEAAKKQQKEAAAVSEEEKEAADRKAQTEAFIKEREDARQANELSKAAHDHLQQVKQIMARASQNFAAVSREMDSSAGMHAEAEQIVERARQATKIANEKAAQIAEEKEVEEAEAKAKAAKEKLDQLRALKAAPKAAENSATEEVKTAEKKVALVSRKGMKAAKAEPATATGKPKVASVAQRGKRVL